MIGTPDNNHGTICFVHCVSCEAELSAQAITFFVAGNQCSQNCVNLMCTQGKILAHERAGTIVSPPAWNLGYCAKKRTHH